MCQGQRLEELGLPSPRPHRRVMGLIRLEPFLEKLQIQVHRCLLVVFASWERSPKSRIRTVDVWYFEVSEARGWGFGSIQWWKQGSKKMTRQDKGTNKGHFPSSFFLLLLFLIPSFPDVIQFMSCGNPELFQILKQLQHKWLQSKMILLWRGYKMLTSGCQENRMALGWCVRIYGRSVVLSAPDSPWRMVYCTKYSISFELVFGIIAETGRHVFSMQLWKFLSEWCQVQLLVGEYKKMELYFVFIHWTKKGVGVPTGLLGFHWVALRYKCWKCDHCQDQHHVATCKSK